MVHCCMKIHQFLKLFYNILIYFFPVLKTKENEKALSVIGSLFPRREKAELIRDYVNPDDVAKIIQKQPSSVTTAPK